MSNHEKLAREAINELINKGRKTGMLTYNEIMDSLEDIDLNPEQIEKVYDTFEDMGIEIVGDEPRQEKISEEDLSLDDLSLPEGVSIDDPVRMLSLIHI